MTDLDSVREIVKELRKMLPPKTTCVELAREDGSHYGYQYVWADPEPYIIDKAATMIEELTAENERLTADNARLRREREDFKAALFKRLDELQVRSMSFWSYQNAIRDIIEFATTYAPVAEGGGEDET